MVINSHRLFQVAAHEIVVRRLKHVGQRFLRKEWPSRIHEWTLWRHHLVLYWRSEGRSCVGSERVQLRRIVGREILFEVALHHN